MAFTQLELAKALASTNPAVLVTTLREVAITGEAVAAEMGYADLISKFVGRSEPEVVVAAIDALGAMGSIGAAYAGVIADELRHPCPAVRLAACQALGSFGDAPEDYAFKVSLVASDDSEARVKAAAIRVLAGLGSDAEVIRASLESSSPEVSGAACEALAVLGQISEEALHAKLIVGSTVLSALRALAAMGQKAYVSCLDEVVSKGLNSEDAVYREQAIIIIGHLREAAVLEPTIGKIKECLTSSIVGIRVAGGLAFAAMGEIAVGYVGELDNLLVDQAEDISNLALVVGTGTRRGPAYCRKPKCTALYAIGRMRALSCLSANSFETLKSSCFNDTDWEVRLCALEMLSCFRKARHLSAAAADLLIDTAYPVRAKAITCLGIWNSEEYCDDIVAALEDPAPDVREAAVNALSMLGSAACDYCHEIFKLFNDKSAAVRATSIKCLASMGDIGQNYAPVIATMMNEDDVGVRIAAIEALGGMGAAGAAFLDDIGDHLYLGATVERSAAKIAMGKLGFVPATAAAPTQLPEDSPAHYASVLAAERAKMGLKH